MSVSTRLENKISNNRAIILVLLILGATLVLTNRQFPAVDDECAIIDRAAEPVGQTLRLYLSGAGEHEHPPLYDLILHGWLCLTSAEMHLLRLPAIACYLLGAWALVAAAKRLVGDRGRAWVLILVCLWPFGFHFGRLAAWYSFCFFLVSLLTWAYFGYLERPTFATWTWFILCALLLVYSNYFGWALLGVLAFDIAIRNPRNLVRHWKQLVAGACLLLFAYLPLLAAFLGELHRGMQVRHSLLAAAFTGIYNLYCIFVSESVAPWFWTLGIPVGICITACLSITLWHSAWAVKRFLLYFCMLLAAMTILGIVETKRLLLIAPWLILPISIMLATLPRTSIGWRTCVASLAVVAGIGWYGIFARSLYAAPHWVEPWPQVAQQAANVVLSGGTVIGNNPSFFFYLTYLLRERNVGGNRPQFSGLLPSSSRRPNVFDPQQWLEAGRPLGPTTLLVKGLHYGSPAAAVDETERSLGERCALQNVQKMVHDRGAQWKERYAPKTGQVPWRIQVSTYGCFSSSLLSKIDLALMKSSRSKQ